MTRRGLMFAPALAALPGRPSTRLSLDQLRALYRRQLFEVFLPFMDRYVVDREYGGFLCHTDHTGARSSDNKDIWYEGRGAWVYSFLYNNLAREERYRETARRSVGFVMRAKPAAGALWPRRYSRDGRALGEPDTEVYGTLFVAEGLAEFSKATGERRHWDLARQLVLDCVALYDRPGYQPDIGRTYLGEQARPFPGARIQGVWMVLLRVAGQMLDMRPDPELARVAARSVDAVMRRHFHPGYRLNNELLHHDLSRPENEYGRLVYTGHAIETLWMVLYEAARRKDKVLFDLAAERFRRHVELAWDGVYGGVFRSLQDVEQNVWSLDKVLWAQEEVLIGTQFLAEHTGSAWAGEMFHQMLSYVLEKYPLTRLGSPLWMYASDRQASVDGYLRLPKRIENYHHPRHLMLNLLSIERMIGRGGKTSRLWA